MDNGPGNRTLVITGTSRGIGHHLALRFLREGFHVIGINRTQVSIDHPAYSTLIADLSDLQQVRSLETKLSEMQIDGVIHNAGIHGPIGPFESVDLDHWTETFTVNLFSAAALTQMCVPSLKESKGFIIFLSGGGSAFPKADYSAYGVSKCGVIRLAEVLAYELAPDILVYCIAPGPNRTALLDEAIAHGEAVGKDDFVPFEYPERLCLFLAKNQDARYSGKFIHVRDDYKEWSDKQLESDPYTLRRIDPRTLSKVDLT